MVSNSDEENWSIKQRQLEYNRNSRYRKLNPKTTYANIHSNRIVQNKSKQSNGLNTDRSDKINKQKTIVIPKKNIHNNSTPLASPTQFRNNTSADPYGIKPLPNITTPYFSHREFAAPNLESWGIRNNTYISDPNNFDRLSPYLPTYSSIVKNQKPYVVVPNFPRTYGATNWNTNNPRLDYISTIPYNKPDYDSPLRNHEIENYKLKSDEYVKNAQDVLKKTSITSYDGTDLFSTKFLEDLDFRSSNPKSQAFRKSRVQFDPIAEEYIENVKIDAYNQVPRVDYYNSIPRTNKHAIDVAEDIYQAEISNLVRNMAQKTLNEEKNYSHSLERPVFNSIFEPVIKIMLTDIAQEVLNERNKKIKTIESNAIKKVAKEKLVNNLMLDRMLDTVAQHGKVVAENDDVSRLMDAMALDVLLNTLTGVGKIKEKTTKNYPLKKFHLNSFMNVALDILVGELSSSLEEDMKELNYFEKKTK
ncbi:hypothetical protein BpHYR1_042902 [Brachionus plicatilis]|uniref:Uncharacterized protein n=1 Tax=Brachionus plicatilis TaxID=10195 RepID=A0A3M7T5D7_BRAPC|nr:hypothetical protein BpHYR1_042902 [Brachionus plicatilis]